MTQTAEFKVNLHQLLKTMIEKGASDMHLTTGTPPLLRIDGSIVPLKLPPLGPVETKQLCFSVLTEEQRAHFEKHSELDLSFGVKGLSRFRANVYMQRGAVAGAFRTIPFKILSSDELGLPPIVADFANKPSGLILVTGPTGSGKSTTLAAIIDKINAEQRLHIITVEDPIEFMHRSKTCVVNQRQVRKHTGSFAAALRAALREDPDVIAIGELRDLETISLAITAAETGHLVLGTLHTNDAARTINRILDAYPPDQQSQIRAMISESLRAIVSQRLVPTVDGSRRVPALEILLVNIAVSNLIREERVFQLRSVMQTGRNAGMCLFDDSLLDLVRAGTISKETARKYCEDPKLFA